MGKDKTKEGTIAVRLSQEEIEKLDVHTHQLSRSMILRILVQAFLEKSEQEQQKFLIERLFRK